MGDTTVPDHQDRNEIVSLVKAYCFALDRRDFARVASVFTEDAEVRDVFDPYMPEGEKFTGVTTGGRHTGRKWTGSCPNCPRPSARWPTATRLPG